VASNPNINDLMVIKSLEAISYHVYPHCATDTLLEASLDDENLIFVSNQHLKSDVWIPILDDCGSIRRRFLQVTARGSHQQKVG